MRTMRAPFLPQVAVVSGLHSGRLVVLPLIEQNGRSALTLAALYYLLSTVALIALAAQTVLVGILVV